MKEKCPACGSLTEKAEGICDVCGALLEGDFRTQPLKPLSTHSEETKTRAYSAPASAPENHDSERTACPTCGRLLKPGESGCPTCGNSSPGPDSGKKPESVQRDKPIKIKVKTRQPRDQEQPPETEDVDIPRDLDVTPPRMDGRLFSFETMELGDTRSITQKDIEAAKALGAQSKAGEPNQPAQEPTEPPEPPEVEAEPTTQYPPASVPKQEPESKRDVPAEESRTILVDHKSKVAAPHERSGGTKEPAAESKESRPTGLSSTPSSKETVAGASSGVPAKPAASPPATRSKSQSAGPQGGPRPGSRWIDPSHGAATRSKQTQKASPSGPLKTSSRNRLFQTVLFWSGSFLVGFILGVLIFKPLLRPDHWTLATPGAFPTHDASEKQGDHHEESQQQAGGDQNLEAWRMKTAAWELGLEKDYGTLTIPSTLEADVLIDGAWAGMTPLEDAKLSPGRHHVTVQLPASDPVRPTDRKQDFTITVQAGETRTLDFKVKLYGRLYINSWPWSRITLDGKQEGSTPMVRFKIPIGLHEVLFETQDHRTFKTKVMVEEYAIARLFHRFNQQ